MFLRINLVVLLFANLGSFAPVNYDKDNGSLKFIILHNNDLHGRFEQTGPMSNRCGQSAAERNECYGGFPRVATKVKEFRSKAKAGEIQSVIYLNAGDTYTGSPWFATFKERITADFMNLLPPDAMVK